MSLSGVLVVCFAIINAISTSLQFNERRLHEAFDGNIKNDATDVMSNLNDVEDDRSIYAMSFKNEAFGDERKIDATDVQSNLTVADDERRITGPAVHKALDDERDIAEIEAKVSNVAY